VGSSSTAVLFLLQDVIVYRALALVSVYVMLVWCVSNKCLPVSCGLAPPNHLTYRSLAASTTGGGGGREGSSSLNHGLTDNTDNLPFMKGIASHDILPCAGFYLLSLGNQLYYPHTG